MKIAIVIPARLGSSRLPRKPLADICNKSMIRHVVERCNQASRTEHVFVLTDSQEIIDEVHSWNGEAVMTPTNCMTGTDRCAAFANETDFDYFINVQGDEPLLNPDDLDRMIERAMANPNIVLNGYAEIKCESDFLSPHIPKVVFTPSGNLLYMSRSPIPGNKLNRFQWGHRQICIYGFPRQSLVEFSALENKTPLEATEDIEILRFLEMNHEVQMVELSGNSIAVDRPEDLELVKKKLREREHH